MNKKTSGILAEKREFENAHLPKRRNVLLLPSTKTLGKTTALMETRHYITMAIAAILLQLLLALFVHRLNWLGNVQGKHRWLLGVALFLSVNAIVLTTPLRLYADDFRVSALILVLLIYSAFASLLVSLLQRFLPCLRNKLKAIYLLSFAALIGWSLYNAYTPMVRHYEITLDKPMQPLRIGVASDLHLGKLFGGNQLDQLAQIMNEQKVDIILLPGDIMDDNVNAYLAEKMQPHLAKLHAPLGVYATLGNHDFFGDEQRIEQEIRAAGIIPLKDESLLIDNRFTLVGRNDDLVSDRPSTTQLIQHAAPNLPIILMDHRPTDIEQHAKLPVDIQISGHTHNGQVFPNNLIVKFMYRLSNGYEKIGNGHFFVTSGYGFWGVPFRLGSQAEVVVIDVKGK